MTRAPVLGAGGIVLRPARTPLIAVVRLRKRNEWVLPKGKLDDGETPRDAAMREVWEETGHDVSVHEFLGTLVYQAGGRSKIVHYWRMETNGGPSRDLMDDVRAVDWLPLEAAVARLSRDHERAFLANVGPLALEAARRSKDRKQPSTDKRRRTVAPQRSRSISLPVGPSFDEVAAATRRGVVERSSIERRVIEQSPPPPGDEAMARSSAPLSGLATDGSSPQAASSDATCPDMMISVEDQRAVEAPQSPRINVMQRVRSWLRRVA
jgi:8-oxo-dGTP diphosphatase